MTEILGVFDEHGRLGRAKPEGQTQTVWYKCSEQQPPEPGHYLIFVSTMWADKLMLVDKLDAHGWTSAGPFHRITHWAHLPEPPK